jgi:TIR domain
VEVWTDSQRLTAGDPLTPTVMGAIDRCDHFLAVLSTNAINSPWVAKEIKYAIGLKNKGNSDPAAADRAIAVAVVVRRGAGGAEGVHRSRRA